MKTLTKFAVASILALSVAAPALAAEENTLLERNTYVAQQNQYHRAQAHRAVDAFAFAPAGAVATDGRDFSIESQR